MNGATPHRTATRALAALAALTLATSLRALDAAPYAHHRPVDAPAGFVRLAVPDDVLDACRADLADLRLVAGDGQDVPYALGPLPEPHLRWTVRDVERVPNVETTAVVDRGDRPVDIEAVTLEIGGTAADFIKPVTVEASADRAHWKELARASIFAATQPIRVSMARISFAPSDRRYLRFRLDDKNGPPIEVTSVEGHGSSTASPPRTVRVAAAPAADATPGATTYRVELPAAHLAVAGLRLESTSPAFARDVRVFDRIVYRGEVSRRLVGAAHLLRGAAGQDELDVPIAGPTGRTLEIEVGGAGARPLADVAFIATITPTVIIFHAPAPSGLVLHYGSDTARPPAYDLAEALAQGLPRELADARLGSETAPAAAAHAFSPEAALAARTAATLDPAPWRSRRRITLPPSGLVAYVAVDDRAEQLPSFRIVDGDNRQIPYLVEREPRLRSSPATFVADTPPSGATSALRVTGIDSTRALDAIELDAREPFFDRRVWIEERAPRRDDRPELVKVPRRSLGEARWIRLPEQTGSLRIPLAQPNESELFISFDDGAERPLTIDHVSIERVERRLDFLQPTAPPGALTLLSANPSVPAPTYDLALVADRIAELPAESASLGPMETVGAPAGTEAPRWLWAAVLVAAVGVTAMLVRTLRTAT